jgi:hypothetical protein
VEDLYLYENNAEQQVFKAFFSAFPQALGKAFSETLMQQERATPQYLW